jgi:hypothetical protein
MQKVVAVAPYAWQKDSIHELSIEKEKGLARSKAKPFWLEMGPG